MLCFTTERTRFLHFKCVLTHSKYILTKINIMNIHGSEYSGVSGSVEYTLNKVDINPYSIHNTSASSQVATLRIREYYLQREML